jgi:hypothetical protein
MDKINDEERRAGRRYPLEMRLRYRLIDGVRTVWKGTGTTTDVSRAGIRFLAERVLPTDSRIELAIDWPARFGGLYPMELVVFGTISRSNVAGVVVQIAAWKFSIKPGGKSDIAIDRAQGWVARCRSREPHQEREAAHAAAV